MYRGDEYDDDYEESLSSRIDDLDELYKEDSSEETEVTEESEGTATEGLKVDKIFDNTFGESEYDGNFKSTFTVDNTFHDYEEAEEKIHYNLLFQKIHGIIKQSPYAALNEIKENGKISKLNKMQINQVYGFVLNSLPGNERKIEIFSILSDYFDIHPSKFYSSLSNKYKNELIMELDQAMNIFEKKKIRKLF
jgi:hypothetical protein